MTGCVTTKARWAGAAAMLLVLAGCAAAPPLNFSPPNISRSAGAKNAALVSTTVTMAGKGEATGKIVPGAEAGLAMLWKTALEDSLVRAALFRDDAPLRLALVVKILELDVPSMGVTMVTHTTARYELLDRNTGAVVFASDIRTDGRSPPGDNFMGVIRIRISASNSVQNNIAEFLRRLEQADLKPAPAAGGPVR